MGERGRGLGYVLQENVEECREQVVSSDMKSGGDKCSRLVAKAF